MCTAVLGIDPGTKCGWAVHRSDCTLDSGVWKLQPRKSAPAGSRYKNLYDALTLLLSVESATSPVHLIAYEQVRRHAGTRAAHVYGGIIAVIQMVAMEHNIPTVGIPVGTIKKRATGSGRATKEEMIAAAK